MYEDITEQNRTETLLTCTNMFNFTKKQQHKHKVTLYTLTRNIQYIYNTY